MNFTFDTYLTQETLENYLSRAATAQWLMYSDTLDDDIRVIKKLGFKFLGRTAGIWFPEKDDNLHFSLAKAFAAKIHAADEEIILQACIFEAIYKQAEAIKIPRFVFEEFGIPFEDRGFSFDKMIFPEKPEHFINGDFAIPDISRQETQMWFFYRAKNYIDAGFEAFHLGQIHLYSANDRDMSALRSIVGRIRTYARKNARRHKVLLDAHSHGIIINGESLLDYNAMPYTRFPFYKEAGEKLVLVREGKSDGGKSPDGWETDNLPYLMEYDNWGGKDEYVHEHFSYEERAWQQWWGWDQIAWFANQPEAERNKFIDYTMKWTRVNNPHAYFAVPLRRPLESGEVAAGQRYYKLNDKSPACPDGFSQEDAVLAARAQTEKLGTAFSNPADLLDMGAVKITDEKTGIRLPEKVVAYGSFQPFTGAVENDSNSEITRLYYVGDNTYSLSFILPYAGEYTFRISVWGTLSATYGYNRFPTSGSGNMDSFVTEKDNSVVKITFRYFDYETKVEII